MKPHKKILLASSLILLSSMTFQEQNVSSNVGRLDRLMNEVQYESSTSQFDILDVKAHHRQTLKELLEFQKAFDNVYRVVSEIDMPALGTGLNLKKYMAGTAYNFIDDKGVSYYITAYHSIYGSIESKIKPKAIYVFRADGKNLDNVVLKTSRDLTDLVLLTTKPDDKKPMRTKPLLANELIHGEDCYIVGYPGADYRVVKKSNIASVVQNKNDGKIEIILDEMIAPGYSGGPVFVNRYGELRLVGIVHKVNFDKGVSVAIPYDYIKNILM